MTDIRPGDLVFCHRKGLVSAIIRLGTRSKWSHVAWVDRVDPEPILIEALTRGVVETPYSVYDDIKHEIVRPVLSGRDVEQARKFVRSCLGQKYGWRIIAGSAMRYLTPGHGLWFGMDGTEICSGLCGQALVRGWYNFTVNPASMSPEELYEQTRRTI